MSQDIVDQLRYYAILEEPAPWVAMLKGAIEEIETLRAELAECQKESQKDSIEMMLQAMRNGHTANTYREKLTAAQARIAELVDALELIASPPRPDGTFNRCREACQELAIRALKKGNP